MNRPRAQHRTAATAPWLDQNHPHTSTRSRKQIAAVLSIAGSTPRRVLDLGCGGGRVLVPLARAGHRVVGIDHDEAAVDRCRSRLVEGTAEVEVMLRCADFESASWPNWSKGRRSGAFDLVLILGNTLMTITDVGRAVRLLRRVRRRLAPGGRLLVDDLPHDLWPELTSGRWQSGVTDDGSMQIAWDPAEPLFALRSGSAVRPRRTRPEPGERVYRLWTMSELRLAAMLARLSEPAHLAGQALLAMQPT